MGSKTKTKNTNVALDARQLGIQADADAMARNMSQLGYGLLDSGTSLMSDTARGIVSQPALDNANASIYRATEKNDGRLMNTLNKRGLFGNNSALQSGLNDSTQNTTNAVTDNYMNLLSNQGNLANKYMNHGYLFQNPLAQQYANELNFNKGSMQTYKSGGFLGGLISGVGSVIK